MEPQLDEGLETLLSKLLDDELTETETAELTDRVRNDPQAREGQHGQIQLHAMLHWSEGKAIEPEAMSPDFASEVPGGTSALPVVLSRLGFLANPGVRNPTLFTKYAVLAGVLSAGMFLGWLATVIGSSTWERNDRQVAQSERPTEPKGPVNQLAPPAATAATTGLLAAPDSRVPRTFGAIGKEQYVLNGYGEAELLRHDGRGCLTHMWFGGDWPGYEKTRLRVYVDGEESPSIDMQMGLGHGCGFADSEAPWGSQKLGKTGHPSGIYNSYKIPFGRSIRVTAQRDKSSPDEAPFWWIVRGTENLPVTVAGVRLPENARLKLYKLRQHVAKPLDEFSLCDVAGAGALYQVTIAGKGLNDTGGAEGISYLEACMRAYIDGAAQPLMLSSGLEDYFLGTYYFNRGRYANGLAGLTHLDLGKREFSAYRFHDEDPVFFQKGLRLTCRCGELINGKMLHKTPTTEFTTYAWVYQW